MSNPIFNTSQQFLINNNSYLVGGQMVHKVPINPRVVK